jgi:integrase
MTNDKMNAKVTRPEPFKLSSLSATSEPKTKKGRQDRGDGSVYRKKPSMFWTLAYNDRDGNRIKEPAKTKNWKEAKARLAERVREARLGKAGYVPDFRAVTVSDLYGELRKQIKADVDQGKRKVRALDALGWRWNKGRWGDGHLKESFGDLPAANVTTKMVEDYKNKRVNDDGAAPATAHREMSTLKAAYKLGKKLKLIEPDCGPTISIEKENNEREGIIEDWEFDRLAGVAARADGERWLEAFIHILNTWGWRRGELLNLRVSAVDLEEQTLRLKPEETKGNRGRVVLMTEKVRELVRPLVAGKTSTDYVFTWGQGKKGKKKAKGTPVKWFKPEWEKLFADAQVPLRLVHDFRRTACTNLRRAGQPNTVIMKMMGWANDEMIKRYDRPNLDDQANALAELDEARELRRKLKAEKRANEELRQRLEAAQRTSFESVSPRIAPELDRFERRVQ